MNSQQRILTIIMRLLAGQQLKKSALMNEFKSSEASVRRDMSYIEEAFESEAIPAKFQRNHQGEYWLSDSRLLKAGALSDSQIHVLLMIILSSRGLTNAEMHDVVTRLHQQAHTPVSGTLNDEFNYQGVPKQAILTKLEQVQAVIDQHIGLTFEYHKDGVKQHFTRWPTGIFFADLYFYMVTGTNQAPDDPDRGEFSRFRISNMSNLKVITQQKSQAYATRFQPAVLRAETPIPYLGKPITLTIDFCADPTYVLDRFPDSQVVSTKGKVSRIVMHVNDGYGIRMWLLEQAGLVKVLHPTNIRQYVIQCLKDALHQYE